jgi:calcium/calmodulin-dependent protein kinase I
MGNVITLCPSDAFYGDEAFENTYEIDESHPIGTGKFSEVFLCWRKNAPEKRYALKVINTRNDDHVSLTRIYEEIDILRILGNHPSIIQLVDVDDTPELNRIRVVAELCEGGELYDRIQSKQFYPEQQAKVLVRNLLEAVAYIHSKGIMHRDLKPENILLASKHSDTDIKISDFGLARLSKDYPRRLPRSHSICGSDFYLAPEVIKQEEYGREIDIWSVGVVAYVLLSGSLPFFHNVLHKLYRQIMERDLSFADERWKNVSKGAQDFILRLLQVRAGDRLTAEQALNHPWLRGTASNSFAAQNSFNQNQGHLQSPVPGHRGNPLQHPHAVGPNGEKLGDQKGASPRMSNGHAPNGSPHAPNGSPQYFPQGMQARPGNPYAGYGTPQRGYPAY